MEAESSGLTVSDRFCWAALAVFIFSWRRSVAAGASCVALGLLGHLAAAASGGSTVAERIERIEKGLLPPTLIHGKPAEVTSLQARMNSLHVPGVSIAMIHKGRIEWARGFGVASVGGPSVTTKTMFQAASISKVLTTFAVLRLVQIGRLDLDTDVNNYLKSWKVPPSEFLRDQAVTLRELLSHSAAVTVNGFAGYPAGAQLPTLVQVLNGEAPANNDPIRVDSVPGKATRYSGGGYVIAQQVLIDVSRMSFPKLLHDQVLAPLGMLDSTFDQPLAPNGSHQAAFPYDSDGHPVPRGPHVYPELAAAGLWTTPSDLARLAIAIQESLSGASQAVLSSTTSRIMLTPLFPLNPSNSQALGFVVGGNPSHPYFHFGGANEGYRSMLVVYNSGDGVALMTNSDNGGDLLLEIVRTVAYEYGWPDWGPELHN